MAKILIIDDDDLIRSSLSRCFSDMGHDVLLAGNLTEGALQAQPGVDVIYLDINLPDGDGLSAINSLTATPTHPEIIVITGLSDNFGAEETLRSGAWDYIQKPATPSSIKASLNSALSYRKERGAPQKPEQTFDDCGIIGTHPSMVRVKQLIAKAAESEASVLILGETGVGKELTARAVHANSPRRAMPYVVVDCSNLSENLMESVLYGHVKGSFTGAHTDHRGLVAEADGGTLFLDEIGELPPLLQKSFLRVLQEHRFRPVGSSKEQTSDFRLVAATNRDLDAMTLAGTFRSDLLFRLRTVEVALPALRDRGDDVSALAEHFVRTACGRYALPVKTLSKKVTSILAEYTWPGNARELGNVMEAAVIEAGQDSVIYPKHLPSHIRVFYLDKGKKVPASSKTTTTVLKGEGGIQTYAAYKSMRDRAYFEHLMDICDMDITVASQLAGLSVPSIYRHLGLAGIATKNRTKG